MERALTIAFVGDIFLGDQAGMRLAPEVRATLASADLVVGNLEGPIAQHDTPIAGKGCLRMAPPTAALLSDWGIQAVSLANNHVFDHGWAAFEETRRRLADLEIRCCGAGENLSAACQPLRLEVRGLRLGLLAYSWGLVQTRVATPDSFGAAPLEPESMRRQVAQLRREVDVVVVLPHWGYCEYYFPKPEQIAWADELLAAGAAAVVGTHTHTVQGLLLRDGRIVAFSLGNFVFAPYRVDGHLARLTRENHEGLILKLRCAAGQLVEHEPIFTRFDGQTILLDDPARRAAKLAQRSAPLARTDYEQVWRHYVRRRAIRRVLHYANPLTWRGIRKETLEGGLLALKGALGLDRGHRPR